MIEWSGWRECDRYQGFVGFFEADDFEGFAVTGDVAGRQDGAGGRRNEGALRRRFVSFVIGAGVAEQRRADGRLVFPNRIQRKNDTEPKSIAGFTMTATRTRPAFKTRLKVRTQISWIATPSVAQATNDT